MHNVIIIGSGPAGCTAAIYTARAKLEPLVIAGIEPGGQLMGTTEVENYPGFEKGIDGPTLMMEMRKQAERFGAKFIDKNASSFEMSGTSKKVKLGDKTLEAKTIILATGARPRKLGIPGEDTLWGKGVSSCATCDGAFYREKVVAVVGGGDSAVEEATFLTRFASKVYLIHRRDELRASKIMADRAKENEKVEILWNTEVKEVLGSKKVTGLKLLNNKESSESEIELDGFFLAIGHIPETKIYGNEVKVDFEGYLLKNCHLENPNPKLLKYKNSTHIPGVFVAGDVQDHIYRQAVTAAGEGCRAALDAERYLSKGEETDEQISEHHWQPIT